MDSLLSFGILATLLTVFSMVMLLWPLLRHGRDQSDVTDQDRRLLVLRDRKAEIEVDRDAGRLSAVDASAAIEQLAVELSETLPSAAWKPTSLTPATTSATVNALAPEYSSPASRKKKLLATTIGVLLPLATVGLYLNLGSPQIMTVDPAVARGESTPAQVAQAIAELKQQTKKDPANLTNWTMLAQAHRIQGELDEAILAYQKAGSLAAPGTEETARLLAEHAETLLIKRQGDFKGEPITLLEQALKSNPDDQKALGLMGAGLYRLGKPEQGIVFLRKLMASLPPDSEQSRQIGAVVQRIEIEMAAVPTRPGGAAVASAPASASASATQAANQTKTPAQGVVTGRVRIAEALLTEIAVNTTVFIVARPADGQRMPVAVARQVFSSQPFEFSLGDAQSMTADRKLSSFDSVIIEARLSASGNAIRQSGDLFGVSKPLKPGAAVVEILIDQVAP